MKFFTLIALLSVSLFASTMHKMAHHEWEYHGEFGPENWYKEYPTCGNGKEQSPINIDTTKTVELNSNESLRFFNYTTDVEIDVVNNGHTIGVRPYFENDYDRPYIFYGGKAYQLLQFHMHTHSESTIDGKQYDLVIHMVHKSYDGELAVVGVFFEEGPENSKEYHFWDLMPTEIHTHNSMKHVDIHTILPHKFDHGFYTFEGSLTTPPCTEGVKWFILKDFNTITKSHIQTLRDIYPHNFRPVQPLNARTVYEK